MKKIINTVLDQKWTLLGMYAAWVVLEGSARIAVTYGIAFVTLLDIAHNLVKKDDND